MELYLKRKIVMENLKILLPLIMAFGGIFIVASGNLLGFIGLIPMALIVHNIK